MKYPYVNTLWTNETKCHSSQWAKILQKQSHLSLLASETSEKSSKIHNNVTFFDNFEPLWKKLLFWYFSLGKYLTIIYYCSTENFLGLTKFHLSTQCNFSQNSL